MTRLGTLVVLLLATACGSESPLQPISDAGSGSDGGACVPDCEGKWCGDDGCGQSCGTCAAGLSCDGASSQCVSSGPCTPQPETCNGADDDCDGAVDEGCSCDAGSKQACVAGKGACADGQQQCTGGSWGPCEPLTAAVAEQCNGIDDDCDGDVDEVFASLGDACDGSDADECKKGTFTCNADGSGVMCTGDTASSAEVCNGVDDDCDGAVDEGLAKDKGTFAGCANYRKLIDDAIAIFDADANSGGPNYAWTASSREDGSDQAAHGLLARAEFLLATKGVPLPSGTRAKIRNQAIVQADGFALWESAGTKAKAVRSAAGLTHAGRGWYAAAADPIVTQYTTGPILLGLELMSRVIYADKLTGTPKTKADGYHALVGKVVDHRIDTNGPHFKSKSTTIPGIKAENWVCMEEPSASCVLGTGARAVKWNKTAFFWRAVGAWNDDDNQYLGSTTTYRRIRTARFVRFLKEDMLASSGAWNDNTPMVWHSWADAPSSYPYIEDASHGAWDVGLMHETWRGGWKDENGAALMGSGSASRFRHTYMDNLAIPGDPCVGNFVDGSQQIPGNKYYGLKLITGRRRVLTEWIGMANKDEAYLTELYQDLTGTCEGVNGLASKRHIALGYARFIAEIRKIRGE